MKFDNINTTSVSNDHKTVTVTIDEKAAAGNYEVIIELLVQAQSQSLKTTTIDDVKKKSGGVVASGQERILVIKQNSEKQPMEIKLTDEQTSLLEIRDAINKAEGNVTASLVKIKEGEHQLILTLEKTGTDSAMDIEVKGDSTLDAFLGYQSSTASAGGHHNQQMKQTIAAKNAEIEINGIKIVRPSNEIKDTPEGVTFKLIKTSEKDVNNKSPY
ncbi:MAG: flagellar filament capping protein FliD [Arsenophonus endosymbiont of Dermacentor nuttalli]